MSIGLNEEILAIWVLDVSEASNLLVGLSRHPMGTRLQWRMRYYEPGTPPDSPDEMHWYEEISSDSPEEVIEKVRAALKEQSPSAMGSPFELIRGNGTLKEFIEAFKRAPFVHVRS